MDVGALTTVFMFFFLMIFGAVYSARKVVHFQNDQTQREIHKGIDEIRTKLGLRSAK